MRPIDADKLKDALTFLLFQNKIDPWTMMYYIDRAPTIPLPPNEPLTLEELREIDGEPEDSDKRF